MPKLSSPPEGISPVFYAHLLLVCVLMVPAGPAEAAAWFRVGGGFSQMAMDDINGATFNFYDEPSAGLELLRHSLATRLLGRGASLEQIAQLLRHAHPQTTEIYAKVDLQALRALAQPWPGGGE